MITILYKFTVKENRTEDFIEAWKELTEFIHIHQNSLGSRLHKKDESTYIAYAQWPDKETWDNSGKNLPLAANEVRDKMKGTCDTIEVVYELEVIVDLFKTK